MSVAGNPSPPRPPSLAGKFRAWTPMALLALAMAAAFALNSDRESFYAELEGDSGRKLAIAENLSPQHNFRMFLRAYLTGDGATAYEMYNRFPIGGFVLIKLAILPFGDDLALKVFAARMLMLAFLSAAAFLAYHAIARIASNKWIAVTATLVAFSSYYVLHYSKKIDIETMMTIFALMLTFHGMAVFVQEGRFRQLLIKTCVALLINWPVYALIAPFVLFGFAGELITAMKARRESSAPGFSHSARRRIASILIRSRYMRLGAAALLFGAAVLAFNLISEYDAFNGELPLNELPTFQSMLRRTGLDADSASYPVVGPRATRAWGLFLPRQFYRVTGASIPEAIADWPGASLEEPPNSPPLPLVAAGVLLAGASVAGLLFVRRHRLPLAALALSGFFWALPMRNHAFLPTHDFDALYYVGIPLALVTLLLLGAGRLGAARFLPGAAALALLVFALSAFQAFAPRPAETVARQEALFSDMTNIRKAARGNIVAIRAGFRPDPVLGVHIGPLLFTLSGSLIQRQGDALPLQRFVILPHRDERLRLLTPENEILFLHAQAEPVELLRAAYDSAASREPDARAAFDIYLDKYQRMLTYVKEPCAVSDVERKFFLHVDPERESDLPQDRREFGFDNLDFVFRFLGAVFDGKCAAQVPLPNYPIASVRTGQWIRGDGEIWETTVRFEE